MIGDAPQQFYSGGVFGVGFGEAGNFSEAVKNQAKALAVSGFAKILLDAGRAPERGDIGAGDQQDALRQIGDQAAGGIEARGIVHHDVAVMRDQHVEEADKLGGGRFDSGGGVGSGEELQAAAVAGHETFEQGTIHAVKVAGGVGDVEYRF